MATIWWVLGLDSCSGLCGKLKSISLNIIFFLNPPSQCQIEHPECVSELVLRGIFLCRQKEFDWMYEGKGANYIFPEDWEIYENAIPVEERGNFMKAYSRRLLGELGEEGTYLILFPSLFELILSCIRDD